MATRKKKQPEETQQVTESVAYQGTCVECRFFSETPDWMGAHCINPVSPHHNGRVKEYGNCIVGDFKATRKPEVTPEPPKEEVVVEDVVHAGDVFEDEATPKEETIE